MKTETNIESRLLDYIEGQLSESERLELELWLNQNPEFKKDVEFILGDNLYVEPNKKNNCPDKLKEKLLKKGFRWKYYAVAAVIVLLLASGAAIYSVMHKNSYEEVQYCEFNKSGSTRTEVSANTSNVESSNAEADNVEEKLVVEKQAEGANVLNNVESNNVESNDTEQISYTGKEELLAESKVNNEPKAQVLQNNTLIKKEVISSPIPIDMAMENTVELGQYKDQYYKESTEIWSVKQAENFAELNREETILGRIYASIRRNNKKRIERKRAEDFVQSEIESGRNNEDLYAFWE